MLLCFFQSFFMFSYISGGTSFPKPLSGDDEQKFIELFHHGTDDEKTLAKNMLIERNLRLVAHIVKKYPNHSKDNDDLISVGTIGLIKAVLTFKCGKGTRLATYAARCIENEILMNIRSGKKHINDVYLQDTVGMDKDGNEVTLQDKVADESPAVDEQVEFSMQKKALYDNVDYILEKRESDVIKMRYGLLTGEEITQREVAQILGISRSYVSRIEKKALRKLKEKLME